MGVEQLYQAPSSAPPSAAARVYKPPNARRSISLVDEPPPTHDATTAGPPTAAATHHPNGIAAIPSAPPSSTTGDDFSACTDITTDRTAEQRPQTTTCKRRTSPDHIDNNNSGNRTPATSTRPRRPDRAVYVPRARRSQTTPPSPSNAVDTTTAIAADTHEPSSTSHNSATSTNTLHTGTQSAAIVVPTITSSDLRQTAHSTDHCDSCSDPACNCLASPVRSATTTTPPPPHHQVVPFRLTPNTGTIVPIQPQPQPRACDTTDADVADHSSSDDQQQHIMQRKNRANDSASPTGGGGGLRIEDAAARTGDLRLDKSGDKDERELRRASKEINRSNRRIIKQTFTSDVLEITDPIEKSTTTTEPSISSRTPSASAARPTPAAEPTPPPVSVDPETDDWESMFDDNGDCLDPKLIDEITASVGKVTIEKPKSDYKIFHSKQALLSTEEFPHVLEISGFPVEFKTPDLMMLFAAHKGSGFDIKWVDDTHALAVFSSSKIAAEVLSTSHPFVLLKPLTEATADSRLRAKKCAASLQPFRQRPETCAALARRLVTGALGVRLKTSSEERENERRVLREAKERKLLAAKQRDEVWES